MATMEMKFCRRCGEKIKKKGDTFVCKNGHTLFRNAPTTVGLLLVNNRKETLVILRGINPGKGKLDMVGGFCDARETLEEALTREVREELQLSPKDYQAPRFLFSHVDSYLYDGETLPVLSIVFWAHVKEQAKPIAASDVADILWLPHKDIDFSQIHFESYAQALRHLRRLKII